MAPELHLPCRQGKRQEPGREQRVAGSRGLFSFAHLHDQFHPWLGRLSFWSDLQRDDGASTGMLSDGTCCWELFLWSFCLLALGWKRKNTSNLIRCPGPGA